MVKIAITVVCAVFLSACSTLPDWVLAPQFSGLSSAAELGNYSFDWHLSGERQIAPLQVFDNGKKTWLQFMPEQVVPAIFQSTPQGDQPLRYTRDGDYLILDGIWPKLSFRGGSLVAYAERRTTIGAVSKQDTTMSTSAEATPIAVDLDPDMTKVFDISSEAPAESVLSTPSVAPVAPVEFAASPSDDARRLTSASVSSALLNRPTAFYGVTMQDQNLRKALGRWARQATWTFGAEHWTVDVDIPISGEATFGDSFEDSVQDLLSATELAERPLRPCFYSNRVLRVVAYSQSCDRSAGVRAS